MSDISKFNLQESKHGHAKPGEVLYEGRTKAVVLVYGSANNKIEIYEEVGTDLNRKSSIYKKKISMTQKVFEEVYSELPEHDYTPKDSDKWD